MGDFASDRRFWRDVYSELMDVSTLDNILRLTALCGMAYAVTTALAPRVVVALLLGAMLFSRTLLYSRGLWLMVGFMTLSVTALEWYQSDNHKWLWSLWLLACGVAVGYRGEVAARVLAFNARMLLGLSMLYATVWKIIGLQYFDGTFFLFVLHFDTRFGGLSQFLGQEREVLMTNYRRYYEIQQSLQPTGVPYTQHMYLFAIASSWWTLFIEALWSVAFLVPAWRWLYERRDWVLLIFCGTTYFLAPVHGFGSLLVAMGLAQCPREKRYARAGYLITLVILHLANPWVATIWNTDLGSLGRVLPGAG